MTRMGGALMEEKNRRGSGGNLRRLTTFASRTEKSFYLNPAPNCELWVFFGVLREKERVSSGWKGRGREGES